MPQLDSKLHTFLDTELDTRPGFYYVSIIDGNKYALALGPYPTHQDALHNVEIARALCAHDARSHWWAFGTCRFEHDAGRGALHGVKHD